jgi:hypothetical protein
MENPSDPNVRTRAILATSIVLISIGGIIAIAVLSIKTLHGQDQAEMTRLVFSSVLPLLGTWVGTVLAFYFARESLQAATDSTNRLIGRLDPRAPVSQAMIPRSRIIAHSLQPAETPEVVELSVLLSQMRDGGVHRIPVLTTTGSVTHIVHESTITAFLAIPPVPPIPAPTAPADPLAGKTIADLLAVPDLAEMVKAMGFVSVSATIAEARTEMRRVPQCNDVFVTTRGRSDEPVEGWLTNTDLAGLP